MFRWRLMLRIMGWWAIPMVGYVRPRLEFIDDGQVRISIRLRRRTRNHLKSMYFGALAVGADVAAGVQVFYFADQMGIKPSFSFKSMKAEFLHRATGTVVFSMNQGREIRELLTKAIESGERHQLVVPVSATVDGQPVAEFEMEISVKIAKADRN